MGNKCTKCSAVQKACLVCQSEYCASCDAYKSHNKGTPYGGSNTIQGFIKQNRGDAYKCRMDGCYNVGTYHCSKNSCCAKFCQDHMIHLHFTCCYPECKQYAITYSAPDNRYIPDRWFCKPHGDYVSLESHRMYTQKQSQQNVSYAPYGKCLDCRKALTYDRISIKYCVDCNGKWQHLRSQGISGPFGGPKK